MSLLNDDSGVLNVPPRDEAATAVGRSGLLVKSFEDGAIGIVDSTTKQAMHLGPDKALQLRDFVRMFDQRNEPVNVLTEARDIIHGDRERTHGEPGRNLAAIAAMWQPIFGAKVTPEQVCLAMIALKVARAVNQPSHRDHWTDIVGYVALAERCGFVKPAEAP